MVFGKNTVRILVALLCVCLLATGGMIWYVFRQQQQPAPTEPPVTTAAPAETTVPVTEAQPETTVPETTLPPETTAPQETTIPVETTVPETTVPEETTAPTEPESTMVRNIRLQKLWMTRFLFFAPRFCPIKVVVAMANPLEKAPAIL